MLIVEAGELCQDAGCCIYSKAEGGRADDDGDGTVIDKGLAEGCHGRVSRSIARPLSEQI